MLGISGIATALLLFEFYQGINQSRCLANGELPENPTRDVRKTDRERTPL